MIVRQHESFLGVVSKKKKFSYFPLLKKSYSELVWKIFILNCFNTTSSISFPISWKVCENIIDDKKFSFLVNLWPTAKVKITRF